MVTRKDDNSHQWDLLDQQHREAGNQADVEALKRQMLHGGLFWQDLLEKLSREDKNAFAQPLIELEQIFQDADNMFQLSANPNATPVVAKLKGKLEQKPFLLPYVAIRLKTELVQAKDARSLFVLIDNLRRSLDNYSENAALFATLGKWNGLRKEISSLLEKSDVSPESGNLEVRYRISLTDERLLQPEARPLSMDSKKLGVLKLYLKKINRFIAYMVENPDAVSLQAAGYDLQEESRVMKVLASLRI